MKITLDHGAVVPNRAHATDAGADLFARETVTIRPRCWHTFDTGVHIELPSGTFAKISGKSGLATKKGISVLGGIVDEGYTGSIAVCLLNNSNKPVTIDQGQKIAQMIVQPCLYVDFEIVDALSETDRGSNGFGSTGK